MGLFQRRGPNVEKLQRKGDIPGLREAARYREPSTDGDGAEWDLGVPVRVEAVRAISQFYGATVGEALAEAIGDPHPAVRLAAVDGIRTLGVPFAVDELLDRVLTWGEPPEDEVSKRALATVAGWRVEGLAERLSERVITADGRAAESHHRVALRTLLETDPRGVPSAAAAVAGRAIVALDPATDARRRERAEQVLTWVVADAPAPLLAALGDADARPAVARAAAVARDARAVEPLVRCLREGDAELRSAAAIGLGGLNDTRAVPALVAATQDTEQSVRDAATTALNSMGMAAVIVGVGTLIQNSNSQLAPGQEPSPAPLGGGWAGEVVARLLSRGD